MQYITLENPLNSDVGFQMGDALKPVEMLKTLAYILFWSEMLLELHPDAPWQL